MYTCNVCSAQLETPWHCKQCIEYDLCPRCYETENHPHPMVKIGIGLDDCNKGQELNNDAAIQESGRDKLSRWVKALGHSCYCRDANCRVYACKTMKYQIQHFRVHSTDRNQCSVCRFIYYLCCYHSKTCHELKCLVPFCPKLKAKMKQQQKQQRLKQTQMLRRRMLVFWYHFLYLDYKYQEENIDGVNDLTLVLKDRILLLVLIAEDFQTDEGLPFLSDSDWF
ncbi:unnamed protein product [Trichobilharzia regenti]|nr:unnamed protein product [Trichobilharzia regenti]